MATAFSAFYDQLLPELKGVTTAMVDLHLLHTARDFCERSGSWRFDFTINGEAAIATYDVSIPTPHSEIVRVTRLTIDSVVLFDEDWRPDSVNDEPKYQISEPPFTMDISNLDMTLIADETPSVAGTGNIVLTAALKPSVTSPDLPDFLKLQHLEAMRCGTLSRLMRMGSKPWTDRPMAGAYGADYERYLMQSADRAQHGNTRTRLRVRPW
jgi:hypothetical protein